MGPVWPTTPGHTAYLPDHASSPQAGCMPVVIDPEPPHTARSLRSACGPTAIESVLLCRSSLARCGVVRGRGMPVLTLGAAPLCVSALICSAARPGCRYRPPVRWSRRPDPSRQRSQPAPHGLSPELGGGAPAAPDRPGQAGGDRVVNPDPCGPHRPPRRHAQRRRVLSENPPASNRPRAAHQSRGGGGGGAAMSSDIAAALLRLRGSTDEHLCPDRRRNSAGRSSR